MDQTEIERQKQDKQFKRLNMLNIWEFIVLLVAHLGLLRWILYVLDHGGVMSTKDIVLHFLGLSVAGGGLIILCALVAKRRYKREVMKNKKS